MHSHLRIAVAAIAAFGLLALSPGVASAAFTSSQITNLGDPFTGFYDLRGGAEPMVTVMGTVSSDATVGETVKIVCDSEGTSPDELESTTVAADHTFQAEVQASDVVATGCTLRAIPDPTPADLTSFSGPRMFGGSFFDDTISTGPNAGTLYYAGARQQNASGALASVASLGDCGLTMSPGLANGSGDADEAFVCAGYYYYTDIDSSLSVTGGGSTIKVDGHTAYVTQESGFVYQVPGLRAVDIDLTRDPATGAITLDQTAVPQRCRDTDEQSPSPGNCGELVDTPVKVTHTATASGDSTSASVTETWTSTDGASHQLLIKPSLDLVDDQPAIDFPWIGGGFRQYENRPVIPGPENAPGSLFVVSDTDTSNTSRAFGGLTFSVAPSWIEFWDNSTFYPVFIYRATVGPDHPFSFRWILNTSLSEQEVRDAAAQAEESLKPAPPPPPTTKSPTRAKCRVPRLLHSQLRVAKRRLARASCAVGKVRRVYRTHRVARRRHGKRVHVRVPYRRGLVLGQKPKPGALRRAGAKVNLVVQGRKPHRRRHQRHTRR